LQQQFEYDPRDQLRKVKDSVNTEIASFDYDSERRRVSKIVNGASAYPEHYVYAGDKVVAEYTGITDYEVTKAKYSLGANEVVKANFAGTEGEKYYFTDALGSTTALANPSASATQKYDYDSWGKVSVTQNQSSNNQIGYTGQRLDNETGLMALGNGERYYSPTLARFIQQDSFIGSVNVPESINRFSYVHNNPLGFADPSGHIADSNRGGLANDARQAGINQNGETGWGGILLNAATRTGYDVWDKISFGALSRQEEIVAKFENKEISKEQWQQMTIANAVVSGGQAAVFFASAGAGSAAVVGAGLATRIGVGAGLAVAEKFVGESLEMSGGFRDEYDSAGGYAFAGAMGGLFGAASGGKASAALAKEGNLTLKQDFKLLVGETKALGQKIGQRLNPKNYNFKLNQNVLGSNGGGFEIKFNATPKEKVFNISQELGRIAREAHDILRPVGADLREFNNSTVAVARVRVNGNSTLYASGNGAK
jgi:RHS repeat-associated protein